MCGIHHRTSSFIHTCAFLIILIYPQSCVYHYHVCVSNLLVIIHVFETFYSLSHVESTTGCRRLIGSPKLQIIFHERATKYRSLLHKMTYKDKGTCESSPPCITHTLFSFMYEMQSMIYMQVRIHVCGIYHHMCLLIYSVTYTLSK